MELTVERSTPEELRVENSTLSLKSQIEELKQHVYGLEVLNQAMKVQITVQKWANVELAREVKEHKRQVKISKYRALKCYECLKKVTKKLKKVRSRKGKIMKLGISIHIHN